jgi:hypothetical protein
MRSKIWTNESGGRGMSEAMTRLSDAREMITAYSTHMERALKLFSDAPNGGDPVWKSKLESELKRAHEWLSQPDGIDT